MPSWTKTTRIVTRIQIRRKPLGDHQSRAQIAIADLRRAQNFERNDLRFRDYYKVEISALSFENETQYIHNDSQ